MSEESAVWTEGEDPGPNKAGCERAAEAALPGRVARLRAGLLCGPHDNVFRLPWWVARIPRSGEVRTPGDPERRIQLVDARDLATWIVDLGERPFPGVFAATAPVGQASMRDVLEGTVAATGSDARLIWCPTTSSPPPASSPGRRSRCGSRRPARPAPGGSTPRARRLRGCAAARSRRRWPTCGRGCRPGGPAAAGEDRLSPHAARGLAPEREREVLAAVAW